MSIKISKKYKSSSGLAPFVYTWTTDNSCVKISNANGSFTTEFTTEFEFSNEACITDATITLNIVDANGCVYNQVVTFNNVCDSFEVSDISKTSDNTFVVTSNQVSNYSWNYDKTLYSAEENGASIKLTPLYQTAPVNSSFLSCSVTNVYGCMELKSYEIFYSKGLITPISVSSIQDCTSKESTIYVDLEGTDTVDWSTLEVLVPSNIEIVDQVSNKVTLKSINYPSNNEEVQLLSIPVRAKDFEGRYVKQGYIYWSISKCLEFDEDIFIYSPIINIQDIAIGQTIEIPIYKSPNIHVNKLIATANQTLVDNRNMNTLFGDVQLNDDVIKYTFTAIPTADSEVIQYNAMSPIGEETRIVQALITFNTIPAPEVPISDFVLCHQCGNQTPFINMSKYLDSVTNPFSTEIVNNPANGNIVVSTNGYISYSGDNVDNTGDYFTFTIENKNSVRSNPIRVDIENRCSGISDSVITNITCLPKVFNLTDLFSEYQSSVGTWTDYNGLYTSEGGTITNPTTDGTVDFSGFPTGTYRFLRTSTYTPSSNEINCKTSYSTIVDLFLGDQPDAGTLSAQQDAGYIYTFSISVTGVSDPVNISATVNGSAATFYSLPQIISGTAQFQLELPIGTNDVELTIVNDCGGTITRTTQVIVTDLGV